MAGRHGLPDFNKIKGLDLNLLTVFETVFAHSSVSRAASELGMTPSAVSQALQRLRLHFSDPLFLREGKGIAPTLFGVNLHEVISSGLGELITGISNLNGDARRQKYVVYCSALLAMRLMPPLVTCLLEEKEETILVQHNNEDITSSTEELLTYRKSDIIFDIEAYHSASTGCEELFGETAVFIAKNDHPRLGEVFTKDDVAREHFVYYNTSNQMTESRRAEVDKIMGERHFSFGAQSIMALLAVVEATELVGLIPQAALKRLQPAFQVKVLKADFPIPNVPVYMMYNKTSARERHFAHLLNVIRKVAEQI
ncbi:LysR family transcriptional regulator [Enterobacillus tribolii]|uniref:DNA-binding transcriptional LysR family regulator n=1 Tax=Enterobacillus tribolii TaxID=1487935 RepID=A0A370QSD0_9GAMM|nr:LysR family transcriptional regulator [Enterobacillus tribolii]MBW7983717.1 LysR family transcriptional regulator [Enterobacillus tribolii]RDK92081.1 DNA-binding transcriptional LysR family regulator [Enterobacillus tribolii]